MGIAGEPLNGAPPLAATMDACRVQLQIASIVLSAIVTLAVTNRVSAQNDWQFPDPHFGRVQFGAAPAPTNEREYRAEISQLQGPRPATVPHRPRRSRWNGRRR